MQLVTVIVDVVKIVSMDPPPCVSVTGQVVTVVYVVRVSVPFGCGDGVTVEDEEDNELEVEADSELEMEEDSELVEGLPVPIIVGIVDVEALSVEWDVELEPQAAAEPARTATKNNDEACMLEILKWIGFSERGVSTTQRNNR